jgi:DnaJ-class molecular chaperone
MFVERWKRRNQDEHGELIIEDKELCIQVQRHHLPGTLFMATEAGSLDINVPSNVAPDVCYRLVDAEGQEFVRSKTYKYDLMTNVEVEEGQLEATIQGIDGQDIIVEVLDQKRVRIPGHGMPKDWQGINRGDLIVTITLDSKCIY